MRTALCHALAALLVAGGSALAAAAEKEHGGPAPESHDAAEAEAHGAEAGTPDAGGAPGAAAIVVETPDAEGDSADPGPRPPYELTRSLQALQDQIALGSAAANAAQRTLLAHIAEQLQAAPPEAWHEPANARAAIIYTLSGGRPELLHRLIGDGLLPEGHADLAKGALAYAIGRRDEAWPLLEKIDARSLPPSLGAHVALAQSSLAFETDQARAVEYLETARLLAPGTLIEEAALRRQLTVASAMADVESFMSLARQYVRRFPNSVYATNFLRAFPELWADLDLPGDAATFEKLETTVEGLGADDRRAILLDVAFDRLIAGQAEIAGLAAAGASGLADPDSADAARAALYGASAQVASPEPDKARTAIEAIDPARLSETDAELRAAALAISAEVWRETGPASASPPPDLGADPAAEPVADAAGDTDGAAEGDAGDLQASAVLARGREALAKADAVLEKTR